MTTNPNSLRTSGWVAALALAAVPAAAQVTNSVRPITLQECFDLALQENLDLQIERTRPELSLINLRSVWARYDPSLLLSGVHSDSTTAGGRDPNTLLTYDGASAESDAFRASVAGLAPSGLTYSLGGNITDRHGDQPNRLDPLLRDFFEDTQGGIGINLTQPVLRNFLIDDTRRALAIARSEIRGSELDLRSRMIDVITAVEKAYNNLIYSRENVTVQEESLRLARQLLSDNKKKVQVGILASLDEKQSESAVFTRQAALSQAQGELGGAQNTLKSLISVNLRTIHDTSLQPVEKLVAVPQQFDIYESWNTGLAKRPDVLQARRAVENQAVELKYARNQRLPQFDLTGSYGYGGAGAREFSDSFANIARRDQPSWTIGAVASIPLSNKAARENVNRQKVIANQADLLLKKQEQTALLEIDNNLTSVRTALDKIESTRQARIYAEQALDGGQKRLQAGTTTSFEVLQLQKDLTEARSAEIGAIRDYNNALADLFQSEGTTLERKKIELFVRDPAPPHPTPPAP